LSDSNDFIEAERQEGAKAIDACEYIFLNGVREISELTLELILSEAKALAAAPRTPKNPELAKLFSDARPIETDHTCRQFRIVFERRHMVYYSVLNESYGQYPDESEEFVGKVLRVFSRSKLLDFIKTTTVASDDYPGVLQHYELVCLNHVVDIICTAPPEISIAEPDVAQKETVN
jgi:hypothetical protein